MERRALDKRSELIGASRFMAEFELQMTFYACRETTNRQLLFFESAREFAEQDDLIQDTVKNALAMFITDGNEAKKLARGGIWLGVISAAQRAGDFRLLYPRDCERVDEIPSYLQVAIEHALIVLNWHENLQKGEVPPEYLWEDAKGLELWWADVADKREREFGGGSSSGSGNPGPEMAENDLARALKE